MSKSVVVMSCAAAFALSLLGPSSAQAIDSPAGLTAQSDSLGLAVRLAWSPTAGASSYRVYRSEADLGTVPDMLVGVTTQPEFSDRSATSGQDWRYAVEAVDEGGTASALSADVAVTTSSALLGPTGDAFLWLALQQEAAQSFAVHFEGGTGADEYQGLARGRVDSVDEATTGDVPVPWVSFDEDYALDYVGPVMGTWRNVANPGEYHVNVYSRTDDLYLQGSYPLRPYGSPIVRRLRQSRSAPRA